jgi:5'-nucleotidase/UDP-sugar diphosphatase
MKIEPAGSAAKEVEKESTLREIPSRRDFLARSATAGAAILLCGDLGVAAEGKKTFTILHTNDLHSNFIGLGPASDYTPFSTGTDRTLGGYARLAALIRQVWFKWSCK